MSTLAAAAHCVIFSDLARVKAGEQVEIGGEQAHHAVRVKRLRPGEAVGLIDGAGAVAHGVLSGVGGSKNRPTLRVQVRAVERVEPLAPRLEILAPAPKGDRLDRMIDQLTQLGVAAYRPLMCEHAQRKPETIRVDKLDRIGHEAMKQCRRAWAMEIGEPIGFTDALSDPDAVVADASGASLSPGEVRERVALLIGPEGGWSPGERRAIEDAGVPKRWFGPFVLRIEAAACAATAIVMAASNRDSQRPLSTPEGSQ